MEKGITQIKSKSLKNYSDTQAFVLLLLIIKRMYIVHFKFHLTHLPDNIQLIIVKER